MFSNRRNYTEKSQKHLEICRNIERLLELEQHLTLYMYTCLSRILRGKKIYFYVHLNTLINSRFF